MPLRRPEQDQVSEFQDSFKARDENCFLFNENDTREPVPRPNNPRILKLKAYQQARNSFTF